MNEIIFIKGKIVDRYDDLAWDKTKMKFEFDLPNGTKYIPDEYLSSDAIIMSNTGSLYWGISYEAWLEYNVTTGKVGSIYRNDNHIEFMKHEFHKKEAKRIKREIAKSVKSNHYPNSTLRRNDEDDELLYIEEKYFSNNNDYTFW